MRTYGATPYSVAVLHGGPGAAGEVAPVAKTLAQLGFGVVEPMQEADTLGGQIEELRADIEALAPVHLIGWSWGAWLALLAAAEHPALACQVILVGSGPFSENAAIRVKETRTARLSESERAELDDLSTRWDDPAAFARSMTLFQKMDAYAPACPPFIDITYNPTIHRKVWAEADALRTSGALLARAGQVKCPVLILHGDHDPHPIDGVINPLRDRVSDVKAIRLEKCGHKPWEERYASAKFYQALQSALSQSCR